jgi:hypothetical protein
MSSGLEVQRLRASIHCATVLEKLADGWKLDRRESTRHCLKYRRGSGEIVIINHGGRGWWDPQSEDKGDVFDLVQRLHPRLNFGEVRRELRPLAGVAPSCAPLEQRRSSRKDVPIEERWESRPQITWGTRTWRHLTQERALPPRVSTASGGRPPTSASPGPTASPTRSPARAR